MKGRPQGSMAPDFFFIFRKNPKNRNTRKFSFFPVQGAAADFFRFRKNPKNRNTRKFSFFQYQVRHRTSLDSEKIRKTENPENLLFLSTRCGSNLRCPHSAWPHPDGTPLPYCRGKATGRRACSGMGLAEGAGWGLQNYLLHLALPPSVTT